MEKNYRYLWEEKFSSIERLRKAVLEAEIPEERNENEFFVHWYNARRFLSYFSWDIHTAHCYLHYARKTNKTTPPQLSEEHVIRGKLSPDVAKALYEIFRNCPVYDPPVTGKEICPGHFFGPGVSEASAVRHTEMFVTRKMTPEMSDFLRSVLEDMKEELEVAMGHYWRIGHVRMYDLQPDKSDPDIGWHSDGWPVGLKKIYIYLDGASMTRGTTQFRNRDGSVSYSEGPAGTWGLFDNSLIIHRAHPSETLPRPAIEISFYPALTTDTTPVHKGITGNFPWYPLDYDEIAACPAIPPEFSVDSLEFRTLARTMGLARNMPFTDCSLGIDEFFLPDGWNQADYVSKHVHHKRDQADNNLEPHAEPSDSSPEKDTARLADLHAAQERIDALQVEMESIYASRSWRLATLGQKLYRSIF